jgi:PAS domain S-box-containing protein
MALEMQNEDDLRKNEQEKIAILDSLMEHVVYHDRGMKILWANRAACESVHMKREDLLGRHCYEVWADRRDPCEDCPVLKTHETEQPQTVEKMTPDGRWWHVQSHPVRDSNGRFTGATEITLDITERKRAEEAASKAKDELEIKIAERTAELNEANCKLRQEIEVRKKAEKELEANEMLLSSTFDALQDLVIVIDKDFRVKISNWKDHNYISEKDRQGYPYCYEVFMNRKKPCNPCPAMEVFTTGEIKQLEGTNPIDGTIRDLRVLPMFDDKGNVVAVIEHIRDISDQKIAEKHIHTLSHELMQAQESERQMLSRELHDTVAQDLSVAKMECDLIYAELLNGRIPEAQRVREIIGVLRKTIAGVRNMAYELRPPGLEELGLVETIYQFCEDFTQMWGVPVDFQSAGLKNLKLDHNIQINLYRLVQEGLTNIRKHAAASRVTVKLAAAFPNIIIRIEDNGRGFDVQQRASADGHEKRMGLRSMQERVNLMNGEMKLQSKPGQGTKVAVKLPFEEKKSSVQENHLDR